MAKAFAFLFALFTILDAAQSYAATLTTYDFSGSWLRGPDSIVTSAPRQPFSGTLIYPVDPSGPNGVGSILILDLFDDETNVSTFGNGTVLFALVIVESAGTFFEIAGGERIIDASPEDIERAEDIFVDPPVEDFFNEEITVASLAFADEAGLLQFTRTPPDEIVFEDFGNFGTFRLETVGNPEFLIGFVDTFELREDPTVVPIPAALPLLTMCLSILLLLGRSQRCTASDC